MEEILASIRKIISEDQPAEVAKPAAPAPVAKPAPAKPQPVAAVEPVAARVAAPAGELDVLELTEEVHDDIAPAPALAPAPAPVKVAEPVRMAPPPMPAPPIEDDVIFQNIEPVSRVKEPPMDDDLISDMTRSAVGRAFQNLNGQGPQVALKGSIEAIFAEAVQQAFRPALREWIEDHSNDVMDQLRPVIRAWMDEHLPPLVEAAVAKEIARAAARKS